MLLPRRGRVAQFELELEPRRSGWTEAEDYFGYGSVHGEEYLDATMRSIVNQEYPNLEYIVVDDGSTDGTARIIRARGELLD